MNLLRSLLRLDVVILVLLLIYPLTPLDPWQFRYTGRSLGSDMVILFIFSILALGLNVVVGYAGLLQLGIAAFFGIGAYVAGIVTVPEYPFQFGFLGGMVCAVAVAALMGLILGAPTLRLRGDYLALVTLGFGEVVRAALRNLEGITAGTRVLSPVPPPPDWMGAPFGLLGLGTDWTDIRNYHLFFYLALGLLVLVFLLLNNLEKSRLGRAWMAIREDELAATCMGLSANKVKLSAFSLGAGLAALAGCLYATRLETTAGPDAYDFNRSITILCCLIVGGLGSLRGALLGVVLVIGFDYMLSGILDTLIQQAGLNPTGSRWLTFSSYKLLVYGLALILMMRFRPEGLLPSSRVKEELHPSTVGAN